MLPVLVEEGKEREGEEEREAVAGNCLGVGGGRRSAPGTA